jgi:hypothetical protein
MIELDRLLRNDEKFREWVDSHDGGEVVGKTGSPFDCPVARWLKSYGVHPSVGNSTIHLSSGEWEPTPMWVKNVIYFTAHLAPERSTRELVLEILDIR